VAGSIGQRELATKARRRGRVGESSRFRVSVRTVHSSSGPSTVTRIETIIKRARSAH
jgi:hypothetical protein